MYTLGPLACRFEQAVDRDLVSDPDIYTKIALDALLRGDMLSRYQAHNIAIQGGWELVNEARALEDRNPIAGGDIPRYPLNMQPAGGGPDENEQGGQPGKGTPKRKPQPVPAPEDDQDEYGDGADRPRRKRAKREAVFTPLIEDGARRIAVAEVKGMERRAPRAAENMELWRTWATGFYDKQTASFADALQNTATAWRCDGGGDVDVARVACEIRRAAAPLFADGADIPGILETWKTTRAAEVSAIIKGGFGYGL
jgi:hypothetical protein